MIHRNARPENQDIWKLRIAAGHGDAEAQFNVGYLYYMGEGTGQDCAEAAKWYRLAAEQGNATAQNSLGVMYDDGEGVPQDRLKACAWLSLSASHGKENAARGKDLLRPSYDRPPASGAWSWKPSSRPAPGLLVSSAANQLQEERICFDSFTNRDQKSPVSLPVFPVSGPQRQFSPRLR